MKLNIKDAAISGAKSTFMRIGKDINESAHIEVNGLQIIGDDIIGFDIQTSTSDSEALSLFKFRR